MAGAAEEGCRPAVADDVPRLVELVGAAIEELRAGRGGAVWARHAARRPPFEPALQAELEAPDHLVLVGTLDDLVMGYGAARVERLPDGKERSQPLSLRGLYNQAIPFHFGTLSAGTKMLDVFGDLQISPGDAMGIKITTRSRVIDSAPYPQPRPRDYPEEEPWPPLYVGSTNATLKIDPGEVVSVPLPPVGRGGADAEAFAARALSFRLRVRQIR